MYGFFHDFPYTNFHELNLDWILRKIIEQDHKISNFINLETIKYADPILWNITTQYMKNTVVVDPDTGTAYISVQAVPSGVYLTNTDYWTVIFTLDIVAANKNLTEHDAGGVSVSTFSSNAGDWLIWRSVLYKVIQDIPVNTAYVPGVNIEQKTVEEFLIEEITARENADYVINSSILSIRGDITDINSSIYSLSLRELPIYTPKSLGMENSDLSDVIKALPEGCKLLIPTGSYNLKKEIVVDKKCEIDFNNSTLTIDKDDFTLDPVTGQGSRGWSFAITAPCVVKNLTLDCGNGDHYENYYTYANTSVGQIWGVVVRSSDVKLERITVKNTAINGFSIYNGDIHNIEVAGCSVLNSCAGMLIETPADQTTMITGTNVHDCYFETVAGAVNGTATASYKNCTFRRHSAGASYNTYGYFLIQAGINDAEVPEGALTEFDTCAVIDEVSTRCLVRIYGINNVSLADNKGTGVFINCLFKSSATYGVENIGNAVFISCKFEGTSLQVSNAKDTNTVAIMCEINPGTDVQFGSMVGGYQSGHSNYIFIGNYTKPTNTNMVTLPAAGGEPKGNSMRVVAIGNIFRGAADLTYLTNSIVCGNRDISNWGNLLTTTPSAANASSRHCIVDNRTITYS